MSEQTLTDSKNHCTISAHDGFKGVGIEIVDEGRQQIAIG
jgi:hypothetical protein